MTYVKEETINFKTLSYESGLLTKRTAFLDRMFLSSNAKEIDLGDVAGDVWIDLTVPVVAFHPIANTLIHFVNPAPYGIELSQELNIADGGDFDLLWENVRWRDSNPPILSQERINQVTLIHTHGDPFIQGVSIKAQTKRTLIKQQYYGWV